ncbi:hypothetical protein [Orientia tsutsugamushi]|uniref:Uncharacterized protein n=1 Tax=Orientia tsutsugamushi TaxID=784 RepID=A0A2U3QQB2_ORITS|nr:hypothetical protein [Orientia tsutsugamushi]KJV56626.1 hypothetical protein OTSKATO_0235 [Orientia tsutsugamushi str. Kato PP]SPR03163.1 Uncharacterised protein [Orientia tsutsugamushi]
MCIKDRAEEIYKSFRDYCYEINKVQHYESVDRSGNKDHADTPGSVFWSTLCGYKCLIDCYQVVYNKDCAELKEFSAHLNEMFKQQLLISYTESKLERKCRIKLAEKIINDLEAKGVVYVACDGFYGVQHAAILKCIKNNAGNYCGIIYNAGFGANTDNIEIADLDRLLKMNGVTNYNRQLYSGIKYTIDDSYRSKKLIESMILHQMGTGEPYQSERPIKSMMLNQMAIVDMDTMSNNVNLSVEPVNAKKVVSSQQNYGNCTTRSIREALRDNISEEVFRELYDFITMVPYSSKLEMLEKVVGKLQNVDNSVLKKYDASLSTKENFLSMFQCNVNHILGVDKSTAIQNLQNIEFLNVNNGRLLCDEEGLSFLAESHARNCVNAGLIKLNSEKSKAIIDFEAAIGSNGSEKVKFYLSDMQYGDGYNAVTKRALLGDVFLDGCNYAFFEFKLRDISRKVLPLSWQSMNLQDISIEDKIYIVYEVFFGAVNNCDAYLTKPLLLPVKEKLLQCVKQYHKSDFVENSSLPSNLRNEIVESWRESCLQDPNIDSLIKAHIAASGISSSISDNNKYYWWLDDKSKVQDWKKSEKLKLDAKIIPKGHVAKIKRELKSSGQIIKGR